MPQAANGGAGSLLQAGQIAFISELARLSGMDPDVLAAWALAEESSSAAVARQSAGNHNWLNIAYFDSGPGSITRDSVWRTPQSAARATWDFLRGERWGASPGIQKIRDTAGKPASEQISAIASSGWASSGYKGGSTLRSLYQTITGRGGVPGAPAGTDTTTPSSNSGGGGGIFRPLFDGALKALVWIALILGGATLIGVGVSRAVSNAKGTP